MASRWNVSRGNGSPAANSVARPDAVIVDESIVGTMTTIDAAEAVGVDPEKLADLLERAQREIEDGLLPSCQIALAKDGKLVAFETYGEATNDTRYVIFSATKAWVASTIWLLLQEGSLALDQRVAELIPEFGSNGKDVITLEQVMLHTSGFPRQLMNPLRWTDREARLATFERWSLNWEPGTAFEYHATSAHWVLAELIECVTGKDFRDVVRERIVEPLGLPSSSSVGRRQRTLTLLPSDRSVTR